MQHTKVNCSSCNRELFIKVAKGENTPDKITCKACSEGKPHTPHKATMKLGDALKIAQVANPRRKRGDHRDKNFVVTGKQTPTAHQAGQLKRIYGSA